MGENGSQGNVLAVALPLVTEGMEDGQVVAESGNPLPAPTTSPTDGVSMDAVEAVLPMLAAAMATGRNPALPANADVEGAAGEQDPSLTTVPARPGDGRAERPPVAPGALTRMVQEAIRADETGALPEANGSTEESASLARVTEAAEDTLVPATAERVAASGARESLLSFAAPVAMAGAPAAATTSLAPAVATSVPVAFGQPPWAQAFGERVVWLVGQQAQSAEISLNPPDLGPLEVRISIDKGEARVAFVSAHSVVREAVDAALPRLREMMGEAGVQLLDVSVSERRSAQEQADRQSGGTAAGSGRGTGDEDSEITAAVQPLRLTRGLVDLYA